MKKTLTYLAYAQHYFGRGSTPTEARKKAHEAGMSDNAMWLLIVTDDETIRVDNFGALSTAEGTWYARVGWFRGSRLLVRPPEKSGE